MTGSNNYLIQSYMAHKKLMGKRDGDFMENLGGKFYYVECKRCKTNLTTISESARHGGGWCAECRDELIPPHIPVEQHGRYLERVEKRWRLKILKEKWTQRKEKSLLAYPVGRQKQESYRSMSLKRSQISQVYPVAKTS